MKSEFYLIDKSFEYPEDLTSSQLQKSIKSLAKDCDYIRQYDSETILIHDSIYGVNIFPDITVAEFIGFSPKTRQIFNKQIVTYLGILLRKSKRTSIESQEVLDILMGEQSQELVHGLLCLHKIEEIDDIHLVYNQRNWIEFHRFYLSQFPKNANFFMDECSKYFPEIYFHNNNKSVVGAILRSSIKTIVNHLTQLNDNLPVCKNKTGNRKDMLSMLNSISSFDRDCTNEGNMDRKQVLSEDFVNNLGKSESVYCELHLKLLYDDSKKVVQNRIYFHEGKANIHNGKVLVSHIGVHL